MLNQVVIIGRLVKTPEIIEKEERKVSDVTLAVPRNYKNDEGEYENDLIPVTLFDKVAENTLEYCKKGDLIGVKGRIENRDEKIIVIAERITFLSSKAKEEE